MNKKVIESLAKLLKFDVEELTKVIATEEDVELKLPNELKIFTVDEYNSTIEKIKDNHGKTRYDAGKLAGSEMQLKDLSEKVGFETPVKNIDEFVASYKSNILKEAKVEPSKKISELETSVTNLQTKLTEKENEIANIQTTYKQKETKLEAQSYFPDLPDTTGLSKSEASSLFFMTHEIKDDGIYKNGEILKDDHEKPFDLKAAVDSFVTEKKWTVATPAGRGGGAGAGGGEPNGLPKSMEEYESYIKSKGWTPGSADANALLHDMAEKKLLN